MDLAGLNLEDDLEIGADGIDDPSAYQDQTAPAPPKEGNYVLRLTDVQAATEFGSKKVLLTDGKWPVLEIRALEILEPTEIARKVLLNQKIKTKNFTRQGANGDTQASEFKDLLRAFDVNATWKGLAGEGDGTIPTGFALLKEFMELGRTLRGRGQWRAFDKTFADAAIEAAGGRDNCSKEELGRIMQKASIRGMKKFPLGKNGNYIPEMVSPNGNGEILVAKFVISRFYPSAEKVKIG